MKIVIDERYAGRTIREVLTHEMGYSSNLLKKLKFSEGGILVNGTFRTVRHVLSVGEELSLAVEDTASDVSPYTIPVELPIEILYEDAYVTAVNKPFGMPSHPSLGHQRDTVSNALHGDTGTSRMYSVRSIDLTAIPAAVCSRQTRGTRPTRCTRR